MDWEERTSSWPTKCYCRTRFLSTRTACYDLGGYVRRGKEPQNPTGGHVDDILFYFLVRMKCDSVTLIGPV